MTQVLSPHPSPGVDLTVCEVVTAIGPFHLEYSGRTVTSLEMRGPVRDAKGPDSALPTRRGVYPPGSPPGQLVDYFLDRRSTFDVEFRFLQGSEFDRKVWAELARIPYGSLRTYGELAAAIGRPRAARAVGGAAHRNPIAIMIPCHRLVGSGGDLTGYGMGLWRKKWLLQLEGTVLAPPQQ